VADTETLNSKVLQCALVLRVERVCPRRRTSKLAFGFVGVRTCNLGLRIVADTETLNSKVLQCALVLRVERVCPRRRTSKLAFVWPGRQVNLCGDNVVSDRVLH
jgi:hypothetical protein